MLGGLWEATIAEWTQAADEPRPPVFILVCKNTAIAKVVYEWLAEDKAPAGIPPAKIDGLPQPRRPDQHDPRRFQGGPRDRHRRGQERRDAWMRFTLDTVGKADWPTDRQGRPIYPEGFEELAKKLDRPLHPPGRDVRCIVSVGMLTEGWDCNTVTHIVGLRPFMSQLLCEQVVGRGLRRASYEVDDDGQLARGGRQGLRRAVRGHPVQGEPAGPGAAAEATGTTSTRSPAKAAFEITFPRVEGYTQAIRNRVTVDWASVPDAHPRPGADPARGRGEGPERQQQGPALA